MKERPGTVTPHSVNRVREVYHQMAMLCAMGLNNREIAEALGYTPVRVGQILNSPAGQDLIAQKRPYVETALYNEFKPDFDQALAMKRLANRLCHEEMMAHDEGRTKIPIQTLNAIRADLEDRLGTPKKQVNTNINANVGADLEAAIARSDKVTEVVVEANHVTPFRRRV